MSRDVASPEFIDRFALLDRLLAWPRQAVLRVGDAGVGRRTLTQLVCHTSPGAGPLGAQLLDDATALVHSHDIPSFYAPDEMELLKQTLKDALEDGHTDGAKLVAATQDAPSASPPAIPLHAAFLRLASPGAEGRGGALVAARLPRTLPLVLSVAPTAPSFDVRLACCPPLSLSVRMSSRSLTVSGRSPLSEA